jgi:hypothetical protein
MPKHANLKPPGRCIFCGALGVTQEHMWANWLRSYIPRELKRHATSVEKVHPRNTEQNIQTRTGDPHSRRIKCVCRACNNGWMSRLQENAKPFLVPMLEGNAITLRRLGQTTLAAWVAMMVMVSEHLHDEMVAIPAADRQWLRANLRPPSHWRIWIGRHAAVTHPLFTHNIVSFAPEKEIERLGLAASLPANSQTSTILLGKHLLIYVMSSAVARSIIRRWTIPAPVGAGLAQIWPLAAHAVTWPTGDALTDLLIHGLAQHFFRASNKLAHERIFGASL